MNSAQDSRVFWFYFEECLSLALIILMVNMAGFSNSVFMLDFRWFLPTLAQISSFLFKNSIKVKVGNALMADILDGFSSSWYNPVNPAAITPSEVSFCLHKLIQILDPEKNNHFSS